jgi:CubicO group peptidase (beta-lactamase class C family)
LPDVHQSDEVMSGFPPSPPQQVNLSNWQQPATLRWSFRHMREVIPTHPIMAGGAVRPLPAREQDLGDIPVSLADGPSTVTKILDTTYTDGLLVLHDGVVVTERYFDGMAPSTRHLAMSVSKSIVGCVAGVLVERGQLDPDAAVTAYVPEVAGTGYHGARVRDVLDMRTGVAFSEAYTSEDSEVRVMERSMGWAPRRPDDPCGAYAYLATLGTEGPHGAGFVYRSCDTDMLGWMCERAAGRRMADLVSTLIWQPMGAEFDADITCDAVGTAVHDGGISTTLRDLARFGQMLLDDGRSGERQVVPTAWLADAYTPTPDVREAFARTDNEPMLPGGWYRDQFWFFHPESGPVLLCLGIHGQLVFVDRGTRTVVVKQSSWPDAQNADHLAATLRACLAVATTLASGRSGRTRARRGARRRR